MDFEDGCVCCGSVIPEGRHVCWICEHRLTDPKTAEALRSNAEGLMDKGFSPPIADLRYIKLANYENEEERRELTGQTIDDIDGWYE